MPTVVSKGGWKFLGRFFTLLVFTLCGDTEAACEVISVTLQKDPLHRGVDQVRELRKDQLKKRIGAFEAAGMFIKRCSLWSGCGPPGRSGNQDPGDRRGERVDVVIIKGTAFV